MKTLRLDMGWDNLRKVFIEDFYNGNESLYYIFESGDTLTENNNLTEKTFKPRLFTKLKVLLAAII